MCCFILTALFIRSHSYSDGKWSDEKVARWNDGTMLDAQVWLKELRRLTREARGATQYPEEEGKAHLRHTAPMDINRARRCDINCGRALPGAFPVGPALRGGAPCVRIRARSVLLFSFM